MYVRAFGRRPLTSEVEEIERFLESQAAARGVPAVESPRVWTDLAHAMFNTAEFLFVR